MRHKGCKNKISKKILFVCKCCQKRWNDYPSRIEKKKFCSKSCAALSRTDIFFKKGNTINVGRRYSPEHRKAISNANLGKNRPNISKAKLGAKNPNWKGGKTPKNKRLRMSSRFKRWRILVFERDDYTCQICKLRGGELHPDHIKRFADYPKLRFKVENGRTLCKSCHMKTDTWGFKKFTKII